MNTAHCEQIKTIYPGECAIKNSVLPICFILYSEPGKVFLVGEPTFWIFCCFGNSHRKKVQNSSACVNNAAR